MANEGTWRPFLDEVVLKGARAYALRLLAVKAEHQSKTDLATARTRMGSIAAIHTLTDAALDKIATHVAEADTALDKVATHVTTEMDAALDQVGTQASAAVTALTNAVTELGKVNTDVTNADGVWTSQAHHMVTDDASVDKNAQDYLEDGDAFFNVVTVGREVAERHALYAQREIELATLWDSKRKDFLVSAARHVETMNGYFAEAANRIGLALRYIEEARGRYDMAIAFIQEAQSRLGMAQEYAREAQGRIQEMNVYIDEATRYQALAEQELQLSDRYRSESDRGMQEFQEVLADRAQYRTNISTASARQPR